MVMLVGLLVGLAAVETWVRVAKVTPRRQIVRGNGLHTLDGVPVWEAADDRQNRDCVEHHPERIRVLFFGSSITFGSGVGPNEAFTTALEARLNELRPTPGFCVLNFGQPGFHFAQKYAVARVEVERYKPALIMWEDWDSECLAFTLIGDAAYDTSGLALDPDGFIVVPGVPEGLNRILFLHSRSYEYLALMQRGNRPPGSLEVPAFANQQLIQVPRLAQSVGAKLVLYFPPPLDRPFAETAATPPGWQEMLLDFARAHGIPAYFLQRELIDQDYLKLRLDSCCHYSVAGHRALVPIMTRIVLEQFDDSPPVLQAAQIATPSSAAGRASATPTFAP